MSGRLIILPKKKYCPWNPANVERVLRDERLEQERLEQERDQEHKEQSKERLSALKSKISGTVLDKKDGGDDQTSSKHVNLFEAEERAMVEQALTREDTTRTQPKKQGIMPVVLGETELKSRGDNRPFYLRSREQAASLESCTDKEDQRKSRMDPMHAFVRNDKTTQQYPTGELSPRKHKRRDSREESPHDSDSDSSSARHKRKRHDKKHKRKRRHCHQKRSRKEDRRKRRKHSSDKTSSVSMGELRRRRAEREQHESQREAALVQRNSFTNARHYQDQYNPGLSRN